MLGSGGGASHYDKKTRTHLMIGKRAEISQKRKVKRTMNRLRESHLSRHDATVQTSGVDPNEWTGNQRVLHYGPLAQRDPFFYYYPKGWDILYPAAFGFFPYRTKNFRGNRPTLCLTVFGIFMSMGGLAMTYAGYFQQPCRRIILLVKWCLGYWNRDDEAELSQPNLPSIVPLQVAGPILLILGSLMLLFGLILWCLSLNLCSERLRHSKAHHHPPRRTIRRTRYNSYLDTEPGAAWAAAQTQSQGQPRPPPYNVVSNEFTEPAIFSMHSEMKLYPPVAPAHSLLSLGPRGQSLPASSMVYYGGAYNTLGQTSTFANMRADSQPPVVSTMRNTSTNSAKQTPNFARRGTTYQFKPN